MSLDRTEELLAANRALRESEERFRSLTEISADFFWETDAQHRCTAIEFGSAYRGSRALGAKLGKTRWEIPPASPGEAEWTAHRAEIAAHRRFVNFGFSRIEGGEERFYEESGAPRFGPQGEFLGYRGIGRDITERKRAEADLRASEARFRSLTELSNDFFWETDTEHRYTAIELGWAYTGVRNSPSKLGFRRWEIAYTSPDEAAWAAHRAAIAARERFVDFRFSRIEEGEERFYEHSGEPRYDPQGNFLGYRGVGRDVTARKRAEEALRESEQRYELAMAASESGYWDWHVLTDRYFVSPKALELAGFAPGTTLAGRADFTARAPMHPEDRARWEAGLKDLFAGTGERLAMEVRYIVGGETRWHSLQAICRRDDTGKVVRWTGSATDITARKQAVDTLRENESRFRTLVELNSGGFWEQDENLRYTPSTFPHDITGYSTDDRIGKTRWELCGNLTPLSGSWAEHQAVLAARQPFRDFEYRRLRPDGEIGYYSASGAPIFDDHGRFKGYYGVASDITARKRFEEDLRQSEARFRGLTELSSDWYWQQDKDLRFTYVSHQLSDTTKYPQASVIGKTRWEMPDITPLSCTWAEHQAVLMNRQPFRDLEYVGRGGQDKGLQYVSISGAPIFDEQGNFNGYQGTGRNITERKRVDEALRQSEERYALVVAGSNEGVFDWDLVSDRVYVSYRAQELFGLPRSELWRPRRDWRHILTFHPDDAPRLHDGIKAHIEGGAPTYEEEFRIVMPGGGVRWFRQRGIALRDASGKAYRVVGSIGDVTEKHKAEEELRSLERQLRLAQRLEAMGTLAGGIAHDFNNILGAILGFSEIAWREAPKGSRLQRDLESIVTAGERGRALIDRILAFSRSAVGERVSVHVEKVVREALDLVSAKLPPSVTLSAELRAGRAAMLGDPTQVHQVLMNLGTNAVQAMPSGGILRVSLDAVRCEVARAATVGKVAAGDHVVLRVADSGTGIAPEILERIFDPFFSTKEAGTGTGLGLSLVHGIVTELGGAIEVESTPGKGTAFTVYLPRTGDAADADESEEAALPRGDGQCVLVVDDEEPLVQLATRTLEDLGYRPVGFTSSAAALAAFCADPPRFDALIADERMPGLSGTALIREVRGVRRAIPILLMSGYIGGAVASLAREAGADDVLKKPVLARDLATSLARVLQQ